MLQSKSVSLTSASEMLPYQVPAPWSTINRKHIIQSSFLSFNNDTDIPGSFAIANNKTEHSSKYTHDTGTQTSYLTRKASNKQSFRYSRTPFAKCCCQTFWISVCLTINWWLSKLWHRKICQNLVRITKTFLAKPGFQHPILEKDQICQIVSGIFPSWTWSKR